MNGIVVPVKQESIEDIVTRVAERVVAERTGLIGVGMRAYKPEVRDIIIESVRETIKYMATAELKRRGVAQ